MNSLVATGVPRAQKARALGTIFSGFHCGNLVGLLLSPLIIVRFGWPGLFLIFGAAGAPLLLLWQLAMPAPAVRPPAPAQTAAQSLEVPTDVAQAPPSLGAFLRARPVQAVIVANFVNHWGYFIYLSWIPTYFARQHALNLAASSFMAFMPWIAMAVGSSAAGVLADALTSRFPVRVAVGRGELGMAAACDAE